MTLNWFILRFTRGFSVIQQALSLQPDDKNCLVARSRCYVKLGDAESALKDAETSLKDNKNYFKVCLSVALACFFSPSSFGPKGPSS